jgi:hypothetical protein
MIMPPCSETRVLKMVLNVLKSANPHYSTSHLQQNFGFSLNSQMRMNPYIRGARVAVMMIPTMWTRQNSFTLFGWNVQGITKFWSYPSLGLSPRRYKNLMDGML